MVKTVIIPHFKNGKASAYSVSQFIKFSKPNELDIVVIDNSYPDNSIKYLTPFENQINIVVPSSEKLLSHGVAYDIGVGFAKGEYIICSESDSFPTSTAYFKYIDDLIINNFDCAGSLLSLSGGTYIHPAGMLFRKSLWSELKSLIDDAGYIYFPNMSRSDGLFDYHLMVHNSIIEKFIDNPSDYIELSNGYRGLTKKEIMSRAEYYKSITNPFHSGMGMNNESVKTYGQRCIENNIDSILLTGKRKLINRVGFEPGQAMCYMLYALGKKIKIIPTEVKWLHNRIGQQQEYTKMENGFTHIWAGSSYLDMKDTEMNDVYEFKKNQIEELYNSLPANQKVKI